MELTTKQFITVHSTNTKPRKNLTLRDIDLRDRVEGYTRATCHVLIRRDGTVEWARKLSEPSMMDPGKAAESVSVLLVGGQDGSGEATGVYTPEQTAALRRVTEGLHRQAADEGRVLVLVPVCPLV